MARPVPTVTLPLSGDSLQSCLTSSRERRWAKRGARPGPQAICPGPGVRIRFGERVRPEQSPVARIPGTGRFAPLRGCFNTLKPRPMPLTFC